MGNIIPFPSKEDALQRIKKKRQMAIKRGLDKAVKSIKWLNHKNKAGTEE